MTTRWFSLRRRFLTLLLGGVTLGWLVTMVSTYYDAHHEIDEIFDAQLVQSAQILIALASEYDDDDDIASIEQNRHKYQANYVFQLWDNQNRLLLRSALAPLTPLIPAGQSEGFTDQTQGKRQWRYYRQWDRYRHLYVVVGENHHVRDELTGHILMRLLLPGIFGLPLLGLWLWLVTRQGMRSLDQVAAELTDRAPDNLQALNPATAPIEVKPLLNALNGLFARTEKTLELERRFTADAAHELRTPMAVLATQAQVARRARDEAERDHALAQIQTGSLRASHLVEQLLELARLDPAQAIASTPINLTALAEQTCADHGAAALAKQINLELKAPGQIEILGNEAMLAIMLRNLIDNAIGYTPEGGQIQITISQDDQHCQLSVSDNGPGIPAQERENAKRRFYRLADQAQSGSGLGLSIVEQIASLHHAKLELSNGLPHPQGYGLQVRLSFPPPPSSKTN